MKILIFYVLFMQTTIAPIGCAFAFVIPSQVMSHRKCAVTSQRDICIESEKNLIEKALILSAEPLRYQQIAIGQHVC